MSSFIEKYAELPKPLKKPLWRWLVKQLNKYDGENDASFMNYGYEHLNGAPRLKLVNGDERDRYCIQLYDHVVNRERLKGKEVLEVGSGRGGGASFIARYHEPKSYVGMDITPSSIEFCNNHFRHVDGLSFEVGDATKLHFDDSSFDFVVNVESSRCYPDQPAFFREVYRVLRDNGKLLIADMRYPRDMEAMRKMIKDAGFKVEHETNISQNVVKALAKDSLRRERLINDKAPKYLKPTLLNFAGAKGSSVYKSFDTGVFQYWSFVLGK